METTTLATVHKEELERTVTRLWIGAMRIPVRTMENATRLEQGLSAHVHLDGRENSAMSEESLAKLLLTFEG